MLRHSFSKFLGKWLPRGEFVKSVSILAGGTALAQLIAVAASPILTRLYKPSDFGALQVFISLIGLALVASTGRYEVAVLLPKDETSSLHVLAVAISCVFATTAVVAGVLVTCHYHQLLPSSVLSLKGSLWLLPVSVLGGGIYQALSYWAMRRGCYKQIAATKLVQVGAQVGTQLGAGFVSTGSLGLLVGDAVGRIMGSGRFLRELWRDHSEQIRAIRLSQVVQMAVRYRDYPLVSTWGALINVSGLALPSLFLAQTYGAQNTGWFALVNRVLGVPSALIGGSIAQVYTSEVATLSRSDPPRLMNLFLKTTRWMLCVGLVPCILFTAFAPQIFQFIFGHAWREAGEYARLLTPMVYLALVDAPVTFTLNVLEHQRAQFAWDLARLVVVAGSMVLARYCGGGPGATILAYGSAMAAMYAVHWTMSFFVIRSHRDSASEVVT